VLRVPYLSFVGCAMSAIDKILDLFNRVKQINPHQWMAACPICDSKKGRPVAIKETDDGRVLLNGFCGHGAGELVEALGLTLSDLFDKPLGRHFSPVSNRIPARPLLELIDEEALVIGMLALEFKNEGDLWDEQWQRLSTAAARIGRARDMANGQ
jgi:hypothetical protein